MVINLIPCHNQISSQPGEKLQHFSCDADKADFLKRNQTQYQSRRHGNIFIIENKQLNGTL